MAGVTPQEQQVLTQQLQTTTTTTTPEEEFLKRNTDCVYFLASPLTCKKGSECEYRHSEIARVNPRDCWYWLNGNCLNPKCAFRHPPLDGLLGAEVPTPMGPPVPQVQVPAVPAAQVPYGPGKQGVPCIFFQKGYCLKGDRCPFLHPLSSGSSKVAQSAAVAPVTELPSIKKTLGGLEKTTREQKVLQANVQRSVELPPQGKPLATVDVSAVRNRVVVDKNVPTPSVLGDDLPRYRPHSVPPATNEILNTRPNRVHQAHVSDNDSILNGKDGDEFSREPSPGFDVLVDDELRDSDYYHSEEQFGRARGHDGRNMNPMNDYDLGRPSDFHSMGDVERDMYRDPRDYDSYDRMQGHYGWEEQRRSSERMLGGSGHGERRRYPRDESPDQVDGLDLRHRISKQRRGNGLRSVVSREQTGETHAEDRNYRGGPRRENHHAPHEGSLSSRLRGRIKLPGRSMSPVKEIDVRAERDIDLGRHRARLSPSRPHVASSQGRLRDRIKGRVQEDSNEGRDFRGRIRRDLITDNNNEFSAPKRLSELKSSKTAEGHELQMNERQLLGKRKYPKVESHHQSEDDLSFEGPKPLSEILKRKRGSESAASESGISAGYNNVYNNEKDGKESMIKSTVYDNKEESYSASGEAGKQVQTEEVEAALKPEVNEEEIEEGMIGDDAMEDHELETYDQREEDFDYEQVDGEDDNLEGGENVEAEEEEYLDEDDGDDFAKKMGVVFS